MAQRQANAALNIAYTTTVAIGPALGGSRGSGAGQPTPLALADRRGHVPGVRRRCWSPFAPTWRNLGARRCEARLQSALEHVRAMPAAGKAAGDRGGRARVLRLAVEPIDVVYAKLTLHAGDLGFGLLLGSWGAGMVVGAIYLHTLVAPRAGSDAHSRDPDGRARLYGHGGWHRPRCRVRRVGRRRDRHGGVQWATLISALQQPTPAGAAGAG